MIITLRTHIIPDPDNTGYYRPIFDTLYSNFYYTMVCCTMSKKNIGTIYKCYKKQKFEINPGDFVNDVADELQFTVLNCSKYEVQLLHHDQVISDIDVPFVVLAKYKRMIGHDLMQEQDQISDFIRRENMKRAEKEKITISMW